MKAKLLKKGLTLERVFSKKGKNPLDAVEYEKRNSIITEPDGRIVFEMKDIEVPKFWSQLATDIAVSKYFRKAGVPGTGHEVSARQLVHRISHTIRTCGEGKNYFANKDEADTFEDELNFLLINQYAAFNSPVWFNCGLWHAYNIKGNMENYAHDDKSNSTVKITNAYERPQCSACFIQDIQDDLSNIFDLIKSESKLFKYGSGSGTNFSRLRSRYEKLGGGGKSSGLMSFLEVFDRAAGSIKSGGTTRRAAKMVCLDMDHPEIVDFIEWKMKEERKVKALIDAGYPSDFNGEAYHTVSGQNANNSVRLTDDFMNAVVNDGKWSTKARTTGEVVNEYSARDLMNKICQSAWACADPGVQFDTTYNKWHTCSNTAPIRATNPCVTGDTRVLTENGKWQRIDSIIDKDTNILVNPGFITNSKISGAFKTGHKKVYKLTTKSGYEIKLTEDHKVFTVNRGFVPAKELAQEDMVLLPGQQVAELNEIEDSSFYQLLGVYLGDGCGEKTPNSRGIQITMDKELERVVLDKLASYVTNNYERKTHQNFPAVVQITPTSAKYSTKNMQLLSRLREFVDLSLKSHEKRFSDAIFGLSLSEQKYVLQGLFTADGTVANYCEKSQYVALDSTSLQMLKDTQLLLLGFGIKSKLYLNRRAGKTTTMLPDGKGGMKEYAVKEVYSLRISASSRIKFEKLIGFMPESYKNETLIKMNQEVGVYYDKPTDAFKSLEYLGEEDVYDLTESMTHSFVANGIVVHNCSEYAFLDDTACNLSSINLMKFLSDDNKVFDVEKFRYACKIMFIAQEILVGLSSYPTYNIAKNSEDYRPLGLGYANLGTLLMVMGIPYDSEKSFAITGAITAIMTGHAYCVSAEMASVVGSFNGYEKNSAPFMKVMNQHRDAAYKIDVTECPANLLNAAREDWDNVIKLVEKHGARNAQATVLAPTGTIGLLMDCDTTGVEPDFSLVKWKKLAGGGYFKIVNQSVTRALQNLGYNEGQVQDILDYMLGYGTLNGCPSINPEELKKLGFTKEQIEEAEKTVNISKSLDKYTPHINLDELKKRGLDSKKIEQAELYIGGAQTIEGAPHVKEEHYAVFDCANKCGRGKRFIDPMGHINIMAAAQPFISGSISKTVNLPEESTVQEIEKIYMEAWKIGLKAVALYRDNCKLSQPLSSGAKKKQPDEIVESLKRRTEEPLQSKRQGFTVGSYVGGQKVYLRTGEYPDGRLGEIFLDMHKEGAAFRSMLSCFAIAVSIGLQYGVPLEKFVKTFTFTRFEPNGMTDHPNIKTATSVIDFVFRVLGMEYLGRTDFVHISPQTTQKGIRDFMRKVEVQQSSANAQDTLQAKLPVTHEENALPEITSIKAMEQQLGSMMGDAPACPTCGHITVRNGSCYKCLNCGASIGCS